MDDNQAGIKVVDEFPSMSSKYQQYLDTIDAMTADKVARISVSENDVGRIRNCVRKHLADQGLSCKTRVHGGFLYVQKLGTAES